MSATEFAFEWLHDRLWAAWQDITNFRLVVQNSLPLIHEQMTVQWFSEFRPGTVVNPAVVAGWTARPIEQATAVMDAATIVFAHSLLDGAAFDYCRFIALHAPQDWDNDVEERQVAIRELRASSYEELRALKIEAVLKELDRKSLTQKIDKLISKCPPPASGFPGSSYRFDRDRVATLDRMRNEIIHGDAVGKSFGLTNDDIFYWMQTCEYFAALVSCHYGIPLDGMLSVDEMGSPKEWYRLKSGLTTG